MHCSAAVLTVVLGQSEDGDKNNRLVAVHGSSAEIHVLQMYHFAIRRRCFCGLSASACASRVSTISGILCMRYTYPAISLKQL